MFPLVNAMTDTSCLFRNSNRAKWMSGRWFGPVIYRVPHPTKNKDLKDGKHWVTSRRDKLLCVYLCNYLSCHKTQIQTDLALCKLCRRQNPAEDFSVQKFSWSSEAICRCYLPLRPVASILQQLAATCRLTRTQGVIYHRDLVQRHDAWCVPTLTKTISHIHSHKRTEGSTGSGYSPAFSDDNWKI